MLPLHGPLKRTVPIPNVPPGITTVLVPGLAHALSHAAKNACKNRFENPISLMFQFPKFRFETNIFLSDRKLHLLAVGFAARPGAEAYDVEGVR